MFNLLQEPFSINKSNMNANFSIHLRYGQHIDQALKLLKGKMESDGLFDVIRSKRGFENPAQKKKRKLKAAHKKAKLARLRREQY